MGPVSCLQNGFFRHWIFPFLSFLQDIMSLHNLA